MTKTKTSSLDGFSERVRDCWLLKVRLGVPRSTVREPQRDRSLRRTRRPNYEFLHPVDEHFGTLDGTENAGIPGLGVDLQRDSDVQDPESDEIRAAGAEAAQTVPQRASREARTVLAKGAGLPQGDGVEISAY